MILLNMPRFCERTFLVPVHETACQRVWPGTHADVRDGVPLWPPDDERRRDQQETVKETCR